MLDTGYKLKLKLKLNIESLNSVADLLGVWGGGVSTPLGLSSTPLRIQAPPLRFFAPPTENAGITTQLFISVFHFASIF